MTEGDQKEMELLKRELDRFTELQVHIHRIAQECETDSGQNLCVKLMDFISLRMNTLAEDSSYEKLNRKNN